MTKFVPDHVPPMTAQHFQFLAEFVASIPSKQPSKRMVINLMADRLELTNPRFLRDRFVEVASKES